VLAELAEWQERLGWPPPGQAQTAEERRDPRRVVAEARTYLTNNRERMDYPRYRREGLPITSSLVESLVGEVNARVKSKQKYWLRPQGAEAILQLRAAVLSQDDRLARFFANRPGNPTRKKKAVAARQFREDLYFRLSVFPITIPPLRDRPEDVEILARHFIERGCRDLGKDPMTLAPSALEALKTYPWPGNVRELQNCIERAVILADGETIHSKHLSLTSELAVPPQPESPLVNFDFSGTLAEVTSRATEAVERVAIAKALEQGNGDVARAADRLQIGFKALSAKIRQYGL
jgi:hypothetical protein